jgi:site-specific DNA-methyltransferase (adenine-specific)
MNKYTTANGMVTIHHGDCMAAMRAMPVGAYKLAIVDPPYGIGAGARGFGPDAKAKVKSGQVKVGEWDKTRPPAEYFDLLRAVSNDQMIFGGNYFADLLPPSRCWIVWDKGPCLRGKDYADGELIWTSYDKVVRICTLDAVKASRMGSAKIHPTQKPVEIYKWLLTLYNPERHHILDTHSGSGSLAIACYDLGVPLDAYELDEDYYDAAVRRLQQREQQLTLFPHT